MATSQPCKKSQPLTNLPQAPVPPDRSKYPQPPDDDQCFSLWDKYRMPDNIRRHSLAVAGIATALAKRAQALGLDADVAATRASGLLHDLAKAWCIENGGSHALIGASWVVQETRHFGISQGVLLHVHWPWPLPEGPAVCCLPIFIIYADKRVRHDGCVSLGERFDDLLVRYGKTEAARESIRQSFKQARQIEAALAGQLKWDINASIHSRPIR